MFGEVDFDIVTADALDLAPQGKPKFSRSSMRSPLLFPLHPRRRCAFISATRTILARLIFDFCGVGEGKQARRGRSS